MSTTIPKGILDAVCGSEDPVRREEGASADVSPAPAAGRLQRHLIGAEQSRAQRVTRSCAHRGCSLHTCWCTYLPRPAVRPGVLSCHHPAQHRAVGGAAASAGCDKSIRTKQGSDQLLCGGIPLCMQHIRNFKFHQRHFISHSMLVVLEMIHMVMHVQYVHLHTCSHMCIFAYMYSYTHVPQEWGGKSIQ